MSSITERQRSKTSAIAAALKSLAHSVLAASLLIVVAGLPIYLTRLN